METFENFITELSWLHKPGICPWDEKLVIGLVRKIINYADGYSLLFLVFRSNFQLRCKVEMVEDWRFSGIYFTGRRSHLNIESSIFCLPNHNYHACIHLLESWEKTYMLGTNRNHVDASNSVLNYWTAYVPIFLNFVASSLILWL